MATLQRFKLLAMQCGVAPSPTRSPKTSPLVQFRRRKTTLRMLLCRSTGSRSPRHRDSPLQLKHLLESPEKKEDEQKGKDVMRKHSLKDLFVSSSTNEEEGEEHSEDNVTRMFGSVGSIAIGGSDALRGGPGSPRTIWMGFRYRSFLRKAWRPALVTIPE